MAQVSINKVINLAQLGRELDTVNPPGFKMSWDGASGYVRVIDRPDITDAILQAAIDVHVSHTGIGVNDATYFMMTIVNAN